MKRPLADRFWEKVSKTETCWLWTAQVNAEGYGRFQRGRGIGSINAHRQAYLLAVGPIPEGYQIDHLCRVRHCVNPGHLEAVTPAENRRRADGWAGLNARKTHCPQDHPYDEVNTYVSAMGRSCKECGRTRAREYQRRRRAAQRAK